MPPAPPIDSRTAADVVQQLIKLMRCYSGEASQSHTGASRALVEIFGRYAELIIERLNQVPNKNQLAFLDLIGASLLPPQPPRGPLTFSLANGSRVDCLFPAPTQVAAAPTASEPAPVVFETEAELVVTAARLVSLFTRRPDLDSYANKSVLIDSISTNEVSLFRGDIRKFEHSVYLAHDTLFSDPDLTTLTFAIETKANVTLSPWNVTWDRWTGKDFINFSTANVIDTTAKLTKSGEVTLQNLSPLRRSDVNG